MNLASSLLLLLAVLLPVAALRHPTAGDDPPLRLKLVIDGAEHLLVDGEEATVAVGGKQVRAKAGVLPERRFDADGVRFDFPRDMAVEVERSESLTQWTLDGQDCVVIVNVFPAGDGETLASELLTNTLRGIDRKAGPGKPCSILLGGVERSGLRGRAALVGTSFEYTVVWVDAAGKPVVLLLQDSLGRGGARSAEAERIRGLWNKTFEALAR